MFTIRYDRYDLYENITLYPSWEKSTKVTKLNETMIWYYTTPPEDKRENFTWIEEYTSVPYWENSSSVEINETALVITHSPSIGAVMNATSGDYYKIITVTDITEDTIFTEAIFRIRRNGVFPMERL